MATPQPPDLELIETETLMAEVVKRYDGVVFCGIRDSSATEWFSDTKIEGNAIVCLAAASVLEAKIAAKVKSKNI